MNLDLIEHKSTLNRNKIIAIVTIALVFIVVFSFLGIKAAEGYNKKRIAERKEKQIAVVEDNLTQETTTEQAQQQSSQEQQENQTETANNNTSTQITDERIPTSHTQLPVYSETAKKKMKNLYNSREKVAYLTFDDGPSQAVTPQILDVLKKENVKATFFVMGQNVKNNPELVNREYHEGHYIANHSYTHNYAKIYKSVDNVFSEYNKTEAVIQQAIGNKNYHSHLFRFPGGSTGGKYAKLKKKARVELNKKNISFLDWNALTSDAAGANTKEKIIKNLKSTVKGKNAVVILMHDASSKILTAETLPEIIKYLKDQGYRFDNFYSIMQ